MVLFFTKEVLYILKEAEKLTKYFGGNVIEPIHFIIILLLYNNITLNLLNFKIIKKLLINVLYKKKFFIKDKKRSDIKISIKVLKIFSKNLFNRFFCSIDFLLNLLNIEKDLISFINEDVTLINNLDKKSILKKIGVKLFINNVNLTDRPKEVMEIYKSINRNENPLLVGEEGTGKKSIISLFYNNYLKKQNKYSEIWFVDINRFFSVISSNKIFEEFLKEIKHNKVLLIFDNINLILKYKKKNINCYNLLINHIFYKKLQIIGLTSSNKYNLFIKNNNTFENLFKKIEINEPKDKILYDILYNYSSKIELNNNIFISSKNLEEIIYLTENHLKNEYFPKKAINMLDIIGNKISVVNKNILKKDKIKYLNNNIIKSIISDTINIPTNTILDKKIDFDDLESNLKNFIIGQDFIVKKIVSYIKKFNVGIKYKNKPMGSWFFCGPSGTGKTELSKYLSNFIFGFNNKLLKFDMSEYMEKHSVSRLIGSPPGYIGYEEGGQLTQAVLKNPYSVVLFDEIEKANPDITNIMLQVLDEGILTDSSGKKIDFSNTYIIFTSNLGCPKNPNEFNSFREGISFTENEYKILSNKINNAIKEYFKPEFINRLNDIFIFKPLSINNLINVLNKFINQLIYKIKKINNNINIIVKEDVKILLSKLSYNPLYGARPLKKYVENFIEKPLTDIFLNININKPSVLTFYLDKNDKSIKYILKALNNKHNLKLESKSSKFIV